MGNGAGLTPRTIGTKAEQENTTLTVNQLPAHTHTVNITATTSVKASTGASARQHQLSVLIWLKVLHQRR